MSKMREALLEHLADEQYEAGETSAVSFKAGYRAAIAAILEGGPTGRVMRVSVGGTPMPDSTGVEWLQRAAAGTELFSIPEDLL